MSCTTRHDTEHVARHFIANSTLRQSECHVTINMACHDIANDTENYTSRRCKWHVTTLRMIGHDVVNGTSRRCEWYVTVFRMPHHDTKNDKLRYQTCHDVANTTSRLCEWHVRSQQMTRDVDTLGLSERLWHDGIKQICLNFELQPFGRERFDRYTHIKHIKHYLISNIDLFNA